MEKVIFERLTVEGFGSFSNESEFILDRGGQIILVKGKNGDGKTTLFNSLIWSLYGETTKKVLSSNVATWEENRTEKFKGTRVQVFFSKGAYTYLVARHLKYKGTTVGLRGSDTLLLYRKSFDGTHNFVEADLTNNNRDKVSIQEEINILLGIDFSQFKQSIFFGQRVANFIESKKEDKVKFLEELFDATWLQSAKDKADIKRTELKIAVDTLGVELKSLQTRQAEAQNFLDVNTRTLSDAQSLKENRIKLAKKDCENLEREIEAVKFEIERLQKLASNYNEAKVTEIEITLKNLVEDTSLDTEYTDLNNSIIEQRQIEQGAYTDYSNANKLILKTYEQMQAKKEGLIQDHKQDIAKFTRLINTLSADLDESKNKGQRLNRNIEDHELEISKSQTNIDKLRKSKDNISHTCPTCTQDIPDSLFEKSCKEVDETISGGLKVISTLTAKLVQIQDQLVANTNETQGILSKLNLEKSSLEKSKIEHSKVVSDIDIELENELKGGESENLANLARYNKVLEVGVMLKNDLLKLNERLSKHRGLIEATKKGLKTANEDNFKFKEAKDLASSKEKDLSNLGYNLKLAYSRLTTEENQVLPNIDLNADQKKVEVLKIESQKIESEISLKTTELADVNWWATIGFGTKGIKSYIFTAGLQHLNNRIEKYASRLGFRVKFSVDHNSANKNLETSVFYTKRTTLGLQEYEKDFEEFSGGEKCRISLCIAFTMFDMISSKLNCNLLIMDEAFENLDAGGLETAFDFLRMKMNEGKSVYIITHMDNIDSKDTRSIEIIKQNGVSEIKD